MELNRSSGNLKFVCSYGGKVLPRHTDGKLRYVGCLTRVLAVDRFISFAELMVKIGEFCGYSVTLKCQLPGGDLETLISITSDDDLRNLVEEYDRASSSLSNRLKIRAILSPAKSLKQISPPPSSPPSFNSTPLESHLKFIDSLPNLPAYSRFATPIKFPVGTRHCIGRSRHHPCHVQVISPKFFYPDRRYNYWH